MKDELDKLLQKQMDRKAFLKHVAIGFAALSGIAAITKTLGTMANSGQKSSRGYGASAYGGKSNTMSSSQS